MTISVDVLSQNISAQSILRVLLTNTDAPGEVRVLTFSGTAVSDLPVGTTTETEILQAIAEHFNWSTKAEAWAAAPVANTALTAIWLAYRQIQDISAVTEFEFSGATTAQVVGHVQLLTMLVERQHTLLMAIFDQLYQVF